MNAGQTFFWSRESIGRQSHRWVVISDPARYPNELIIGSFTTLTMEKDQTCIVTRSQYSSLGHDSCIAYEALRETRLESLDSFARSSLIGLSTDVPPDVLQRIREGVLESKRVELLLKARFRRQMSG